ncbi:MAG: response regulator [Caulobacteraceae bacterium]
MCHVLIIEDEVLFALELSLILGAAGATSFDVAETADEALYAASIRRPDIITSDIKLRTGNGVQAVAAIHAALGPVPVIFITASPDECAHLARPARVLGKPLHESTIARAFRDLAPGAGASAA